MVFGVPVEILLGVLVGMLAGAVGVWVYDSKLGERPKRVAIGLLMVPYIVALFVAATNFWTAIGLSFPIGIIALKFFSRLRAGRLSNKGDEGDE